MAIPNPVSSRTSNARRPRRRRHGRRPGRRDRASPKSSSNTSPPAFRQNETLIGPRSLLR